MKTWAIPAKAGLWLMLMALVCNIEETKHSIPQVAPDFSSDVAKRAAPLMELFRRTEHVYEPNWIRAEAGHRLLIQDVVNVVHKVYWYDLKSDSVIASLQEGNGPGELSPRGMKWVSSSSDGRQFLYDAGNYRAYWFDNELRNPVTFHLPPNFNVLAVLLVNDTLLVSLPRSETDFVHFFKLTEQKQLDPKIHYRMLNDEHPHLKGMKNFLLKNGHAISVDGAVYQSFLFSSLILKIQGTSVHWSGGVELSPEFPVEKQKPGTFRMPDASKHAQQTLSLAINGDRVFALHSGVTAGFWKTLKAALFNDFSEIDEMLNASDRLRLYDRQSGAFIEEWKLPVRARLISAYGRYLYVVTQVDGTPTIIAYEITS